MLPTHGKMSEYNKYQMKTMRKSDIPTSRVYGFFTSQARGYAKMGHFRRDMYNKLFKKRGLKQLDANDALEFLKRMSYKDDMMFYRHTIKEDGMLEHLFWCNGIGHMYYSIFGDVLAFDATYRKIRYNTILVIILGFNHHNQSIIFTSATDSDKIGKTYVWILETFVEAMGDMYPHSIIADRDLATRNVIKKVFPNVHHHLCVWHLILSTTSNIKNSKLEYKFKHYMLGDFDADEFEAEWNVMINEFQLQ